MRAPDVLMEEARSAFEEHRDELTAGDKEPLDPETRAALSAKTDKRIAKVVRRYLPYLLPYCQSKLDIAASIVGLCYSGEIGGIPKEALPFLSRGLFVGVQYVFDDLVDNSDEIQRLVSSTNWRGYPNREMRERLFVGLNKRRHLKTCPSIASGTAILEVLSQHQDVIREIQYHDLAREIDPICMSV